MQIKKIMSGLKKPRTSITVNQGESVDNAALLMKENNLSYITVVDDEDNPVGAVTSKDIIDSEESIDEDFFLD